jgi:hypothetical protein
VGLVTIFYCFRFQTSIPVASYDSQVYGEGIRPRLDTGFLESSACRFSRHGPQKTLLQTVLLLRALQLRSNGPSIVNVFAGRCLAMSLLSLFPVAVTGVTGRSPALGR